jgi:hypothetical protein
MEKNWGFGLDVTAETAVAVCVVDGIERQN